MKCSEELVYIRVSRVVDGPQIYVWLYLYVPSFPFFNYCCQVCFPMRHVNVGIRLTPPLNMCSPYAVWHCPSFGFFSFRFYDAKLFIGPINEIRVPFTQMARKSFSLVLFGNGFLA